MAEKTKFGAYLQEESIIYDNNIKCFKKNSNVYPDVSSDNLIYKLVGILPNFCIPVLSEAITVQGIIKSDPYFCSFKLRYKNMSFYKSDYSDNDFESFHSKMKGFGMFNSENINLINNTSKTGQDRSVNIRCDTICHNNNITMKETANKCFMNGDMTFDAMLECERNQERFSLRRNKHIGLCGGGETSLNAATGWGAPPAPNNNGASGNWGNTSSAQPSNNNSQQNWGNNNNQRTPTSQPDVSPGTSGNNSNAPVLANNGSNSAAASSASKIEQLNSMREALYSQDGWGGQHVNQDTNWDIPGSPEPSVKVDPANPALPPWKNNMNNGTDLWEANLRNGGQPPPQPAAKTPWGHTPSTNIGGTWGEDDDDTSANVWAGPPPPQQQWGAPPPQWQPKKDEWSAWGGERPAPDARHEPRGDLRGISGRLTGDMWQQRPAAPAVKPWTDDRRPYPPPPRPTAKPEPLWAPGPRWDAPWSDAPWNDNPGGWAKPEPPPPQPPKQPPKHFAAPTPQYKKEEEARDEPDYYGYKTPPQPSAAQLRMLVQQIQMAVSTGYLNHQILNQPLAPQTLVLLNQLLQQIKVLQQLLTQQQLAMSKANSSLVLHSTMQINKTKQQISNLQSQIAAQQAMYVKATSSNSDPLSVLQASFSDLALNKEQSYGGVGGGVSGMSVGGAGQSRLTTQWKLSALDKDHDNDFSRAPGPAKPSGGLNPLDAAWGRDSWVTDSDNEPKDAWPQTSPYMDLVPEFEPGKPWKGNPIKSAEEDPGLTPGAVGAVGAVGGVGAIGGVVNTGGKASPTWPAYLQAKQKWLPDDKPMTNPASLRSGAGAGRPRTNWSSTWLLLKNLTAQIDGSTLKTLCMQHGPLQNFHLYLNQGIALARYSTREEANKAQQALNNCVLSNTTIFAESPAESDVQMILQHLGQGAGGTVGGGTAWPLWPEESRHLNSYLPPDLLGGESI